MRKRGYYWIKRYKGSKYEIAKWNGVYWKLFGLIYKYKNNRLFKICKKQIKRK